MKFGTLFLLGSLITDLTAFSFINDQKANTLIEKYKQAQKLLQFYSTFQAKKRKYSTDTDKKYLLEIVKIMDTSEVIEIGKERVKIGTEGFVRRDTEN